MKTLLLTLLSIGGLLAQSTPPNQLQIYTPAPSPVRQIGGGTVGQSGSTTLYYWVIARYSTGIAVNTTPVAIFNTVGTANLTASNYVSITWAAVSGATGYDVLRATTPIYPANPTCTACAVTLNTPNSSVTDTGAALSDYPPGGLVQSSSTTATIYLDNSNSVPYLNTQLLYRATENLIVGLISGSIANGDCLEYSNGRIVSAGAACGSGSGGGDLEYLLLAADASAPNARTYTPDLNSYAVDAGAGGLYTTGPDTAKILTRVTDQAGTDKYCRSTTGNTTYTCTLTPTLTAYTRGACFVLDADTSNTTTATLNIDLLGAKSILNSTGAALVVADITANKPKNICYDGTSFIIQGDGGGSVPSYTTGYYTPWGIGPIASSGINPVAGRVYVSLHRAYQTFTFTKIAGWGYAVASKAMACGVYDSSKNIIVQGRLDSGNAWFTPAQITVASTTITQGTLYYLACSFEDTGMSTWFQASGSVFYVLDPSPFRFGYATETATGSNTTYALPASFTTINHAGDTTDAPIYVMYLP